MNFELRDYQREAAIGVLGRLGQAWCRIRFCGASPE